MAETSERVGEIIEASTAGFVAQCYELYELPPLGSLVKTKNGELDIYGIVYHATTGSLEPGRRPIARGRDEASEEAIYQSSPQLSKLLRSEFSVLVVGHKAGENIYQYLPPNPARIHSFVHACPPDEVREFGRSLAFLTLLVNASLPVAREEIVPAALRLMSGAQEDPHAFLVAAGKELSIMLGGQYNQFRAILGRLK
ncbi:MAG TPA: hypothetical protein G4O20_04350 [Dehalococcoidia bacterium]|nr:hypothetical protein [Dehalococcoidia bacterium]